MILRSMSIMLEQQRSHPPWFPIVRRILSIFMLVGVGLVQYQKSLELTTWMSIMMTQEEYSYFFQPNATTMTLQEGNGGMAPTIENVLMVPNQPMVQFQGRIQIPNYTPGMAKEAVKPEWGICQRGNSSRTNRNKDNVKFAFVHIFKTAGSTMREFLMVYAKNCALGWMVLISCTGVNASSILPTTRLPAALSKASFPSLPISIDQGDTLYNDISTEERLYWEPCTLKRLLQRNGEFRNLEEPQLLFHGNISATTKKKGSNRRVDTTVVEESVDILGGHFKIGMADYLHVQPRSLSQPNLDDEGQKPGTIQPHPSTTSIINQSPFPTTNESIVHPSTTTATTTRAYSKIRHITFVRQPLSKYVSGVIFHNKHIESQDKIISKIKRDVTKERQDGKYWMRISDYLLTPHQAAGNQGATTTTSSSSSPELSKTEYKTQLVLNNLFDYNVIVGIVENISESMNMLQHVLDPDKKLTILFQYYGGDDGSASDKTTAASTTSNLKNRTSKIPVQKVVNKSRFSTSSVLQELQNDTQFYQDFVEYVKYEQLIYDFALSMHQQQHEATKTWMPQQQ